MPLDGAVVMAAGVGSRLRPITDHFAKPVLPVGGRPVLAAVLRELAAAGLRVVHLVAGHHAGQVEALAGDGSGFGVEIRRVRQPEPLGSADAVRRALDAGARAPVLVTAADNVYAPGDVARFLEGWRASGAGGAVAWRALDAATAGKRRLGLRDGLVTRIPSDAETPYVAAPLWVLSVATAARLCEDRPPWELGNAFQAAIEAGETVAAVEIGKTRDLTSSLDLLRENFPYLEALERAG